MTKEAVMWLGRPDHGFRGLLYFVKTKPKEAITPVFPSIQFLQGPGSRQYRDHAVLLASAQPAPRMGGEERQCHLGRLECTSWPGEEPSQGAMGARWGTAARPSSPHTPPFPSADGELAKFLPWEH